MIVQASSLDSDLCKKASVTFNLIMVNFYNVCIIRLLFANNNLEIIANVLVI